MKLVTMTRDIRPFQKNHDALLEDTVADRLVASGDARDPRPWPPVTAEVDGKTPPAAKGYKTREARK